MRQNALHIKNMFLCLLQYNQENNKGNKGLFVKDLYKHCYFTLSH